MSNKNKGPAAGSSRVPEAAKHHVYNDDEDDDLEHQPARKPASTGPIQHQTSKVILILILGAFVGFGTFSTVLGKVLFQCEAIGSDGQLHHFGKPLFQNTGMFLGMTGCLIVFLLSRARKRSGETRPLLGGQEQEEELGSDPRIYYVVLVPAVCDFVATYMMNVGLLWINASVWQMVRGSIVFFVASIRWVWLKRAIHNFQWFGVFVVMTALIVIGFSCVMSAPAEEQQQTTGFEKMCGVLLVFLAQMVQATQCVVEEHLLHDIRASDMQIVGLEGLWGLILCTVVAMPFAAWVPMSGLHEDTWDTLTMLGNSRQVQILFTLYVLVILGYNMMAMKVTMYLNSVTRNVMDTVRTIFIWLTLTIIHYTLNPVYGEQWTTWSYMQLFGFGILVMGLMTYYRAFEWPCFNYPDENEVPKPMTPMINSKSPFAGSRSASPYIPGSPKI